MRDGSRSAPDPWRRAVAVRRHGFAGSPCSCPLVTREFYKDVNQAFAKSW
jgi:hypothetical protein